MQESTFTNYDQLPLFLNANTVAQVLGVSISSAYELMHETGFPALRIGNRIVVPKEKFHRWVAVKMLISERQTTPMDTLEALILP